MRSPTLLPGWRCPPWATATSCAPATSRASAGPSTGWGSTTTRRGASAAYTRRPARASGRTRRPTRGAAAQLRGPPVPHHDGLGGRPLGRHGPPGHGGPARAWPAPPSDRERLRLLLGAPRPRRLGRGCPAPVVGARKRQDRRCWTWAATTSPCRSRIPRSSGRPRKSDAATSTARAAVNGAGCFEVVEHAAAVTGNAPFTAPAWGQRVWLERAPRAAGGWLLLASRAPQRWATPARTRHGSRAALCGAARLHAAVSALH